MRLRVSVSGDRDGDGRRRRLHRQRRHHGRRQEPRRPCGRRNCPYGKPEPPPEASSGDLPDAASSLQRSFPSTPPAASSRSPTPTRTSRTPPRSPARPFPTRAPPTRQPERSPTRTGRSPTRAPPRSAPARGQRGRLRSPKGQQLPTTRSAQGRMVSPQAARSPSRVGPARRPPGARPPPRPPCWTERLGRPPPWRTEDSASTLYHSPPEQIQTPCRADLESLVNMLRCRAVPTVVCVDGQSQQSDIPAGPPPLDPVLERYVTRLLSMSQANVEALNVSSSDVSLRSEVVEHPDNRCCPCERQSGSSSRVRGVSAPSQRSVGVAVTPDLLCQPCAECAPCAQPIPDPCFPPRPATPPPSKRPPQRTCPPMYPPPCAEISTQQHRQSRSPVRPPPAVVVSERRQAAHRSCSPDCHPTCSEPQPSSRPEASRSPVYAPSNVSPSAPLDTTEYLPHEMFTRGAFRRVPASVPPAEPGLPHFSPDYRSLAVPTINMPLRVGGGAKAAAAAGADSSGASVPSDSSSWCPSHACPDPTAIEDACRCAAEDVAQMSERCARRIENLSRLIERVRQEKNSLSHLEERSRAPSPVEVREQSAPTAAPIRVTTRQVTMTRITGPAPTHAPMRPVAPASVRPRTAVRSPPSPPSPRSPVRNRRVNVTSDQVPPADASQESTGALETRDETWFEKLRRLKSAPPLRTPPPSPLPSPPLLERSDQHSPPCPAWPLQQRSPQRPISPSQSSSPPPSIQYSPVHSVSSPQRSRTPRTLSPKRSPPVSTPQRPPSPQSPSPASSPSGQRANAPFAVPSARSPRSPLPSPPQTCPSAPPAGAVSDEEPLWVFAPNIWPPPPPQPPPPPPISPSVSEHSRVVPRSKPPPAMWRPGVPYLEQHELSAIPEVETSYSGMAVDAASERRTPTPPAPPPQRPGAYIRLQAGTDLETACYAEPREDYHGLLVGSPLTTEEARSWEDPCESSRPPTPPQDQLASPRSPYSAPDASRSRTHSRSPSPRSPSPTPRSRSPSPRSQTPSGSEPSAASQEATKACPLPSCADAQRATSPIPVSPHTSLPPCPGAPCAPCAPCTSPRAVTPPLHQDDDDPDIVAELIRRGVLRSPFSWMKSLGCGAPHINVDVDVSLVSGASSDFVSDLLLSGSSSTPRKAASSSGSGSSPEQSRRQRGGADEGSDGPQEAISVPVAADSMHQSKEVGGTSGEAVPEDLEAMFERLGLGWAATMLRKTQEAMAISSSSSETSQGILRPGAGGVSGHGVTSGVNVSAGTGARRVRSTPANASGASDGSPSVSWTQGHVFTMDSDICSVPSASTRDLSTPSASLVVKSRSKSNSRT